MIPSLRLLMAGILPSEKDWMAIAVSVRAAPEMRWLKLPLLAEITALH